ncbi:acyl-CoA dehydrogenase family protein [Pseudomonas sp.]|uniref:acyl-CoA dehydrogenase family protein n=1 Tax=Pseudomonas sp. TaxID=306 RepID=UPI003D11317E
MPWPTLLQTDGHLPEQASLDEWYAQLLARVGQCSAPELAVLGGRLAATPGLAFLAGYQSALRVLWPSAPRSLGALCATENRSVRPADMHTRLDGLSLNGRKDFVTAASAADWLLVAAREEAPGEGVKLALGVVRNGAPGVRVERLPALPLVPDIDHGRLHLEDAQCERLPGDGWDAYVKPFRSIEDTYVLTALCAWLSGIGQRCAWPQPVQLRLLGVLAGCAEVTRLPPAAPATHLMLAGVYAQFASLETELDAAFAAGPAQWAGLWARDKGILQLAAVARAKRLEKAKVALGLG